ncbi:MAG: alpha/beta fold hydrolase [Gemmatimonadota bacterium]
MPRIDRFTFEQFEFDVHRWGDGPPGLLFLPGMGVHPRHYAPGLERLSRHLAVVSPDLSFRSNPTLPADWAGYLACVEAVAERFAPRAPRAGHSLGGLLALRGDRPAIALSPLIPVPLGWLRQSWRAVRLQLREYAGVEGARGIRWALAMLVEYVGMALTAPEKLFPALRCTHSEHIDDFRPRAPAVRLVLGRRDLLYREAEYGRYVERIGLDGRAVRWLPHGHDWPVTRPSLFESEVLGALEDVRAGRLSPGRSRG